MFVCIYFGLMVLAFLTGLTGAIVCCIQNTYTMFSIFMIWGLVLPIVMQVVYLITIASGKDKAREKLDSELGIDHLPEGCFRDRILPAKDE